MYECRGFSAFGQVFPTLRSSEWNCCITRYAVWKELRSGAVYTHQLPVLPAWSVAKSLNLGVVVSGALAATLQPALTGAAAGVERHPSLWPPVTGDKAQWPMAVCADTGP